MKCMDFVFKQLLRINTEEAKANDPDWIQFEDLSLQGQAKVF